MSPLNRLRLRAGTAASALVLSLAAAADEQTFIAQAVQGNLAEIQLSELAVQRADTEHVRKLAQTLRQEHHAMLQRARAVAKSLQVEPPTEPTKEAKGFYDGLAQLSSRQFDAAFLSHMVTLHEAEIANYARNTNSDNDAVASYVADALPRLRAHLSAVEELQRGPPPQRFD
jgi:putative membrane protein